MNLNRTEPCIYSKPFIARMHELNKIATKYKCDLVDISFIEKGLSFAKYYHGSQMRKSGEPYVSHPIAVATMVADHIFREDVIIASLLHDTVEDTTLTLSEIESEFNPRIAEIVRMLTRDRPNEAKLSVKEILDSAIKKNDNDVLLIKFMDRIHNLSTLDSMNKESIDKQIKETCDSLFPSIATTFSMSLEKQLLLLIKKYDTEGYYKKSYNSNYDFDLSVEFKFFQTTLLNKE